MFINRFSLLFIPLKYQLTYYLGLLCIGGYFNGYPQDKNFLFHSISGQYDYGFILRHTPKVGHLIVAPPYAFSLQTHWQSTGKEVWQQRLNYPEFSLMATYFNYRHPSIGQTIAISGHARFALLPHRQRLQAWVGIGSGLATGNRPFDIDTNPKNVGISSPVSCSMQLDALLRYHTRLPWFVFAGGRLTHYSCAAFVQPNNGLNMVTFSAGIGYSFQKPVFPPKETAVSPFVSCWHLQTSAQVGWLQTYVKQNRKDLYGNLLIYAGKDIGSASRWHIGADISWNEGVLRQIRRVYADSASRPDYRRVGIFIGHEFTFGRLALITQGGIYIYKPFEGKTDQIHFQRYGIKYWITPQYFFNLNLKTHAFTAEVAEWGIGYRLKWKKS